MVTLSNLNKNKLESLSFDDAVPYPDEIAAFAAARNGDPDYQPSFTQQEVLQMLGID